MICAETLDRSRPAQSVNWYHTYIGCVRYINYETESFPDFEWRSHTYMHKSVEFRSEQEARIIYHPSDWAGRDGRRKVGPEDADRVVLVPWDAEQLMESIVISPEESSLFASAVKDVVAAFAPKLPARVRNSALLRVPRY